MLALARNGYQVVWLNYFPALAVRYREWHENLTFVADLRFAALRDLYRSCAAVVLPLTRDVHAAGQTTGLEALASGAAVILSNDRTADLFAGAGLIDAVDGRDLEAWSSSIERVLARERSNPELVRSRAAHVASHHAPEAVAREVRRGLATVPCRA